MLLEGGETRVIDGVRFGRPTLWSDWRLAGAGCRPTPRPARRPVAYAAARMTDPATGSREYRAIRRGDGTPWTPQAAMEPTPPTGPP